MDKRLYPFRNDLAASFLKGKVEAEKFVDGTKKQVGVGMVTLRAEPTAAAPAASQLLHGEVVTVYEQNNGWAWVQNEKDDYVGYLPDSILIEDVPAPTHRIQALRTVLFSDPELKSPPLDIFSMNAEVSVFTGENGFAGLATGGFITAKHLCTIDEFEKDYVEVALKFLHTPYLWGGRSSIGLDCSALVQLSLEAVNIKAPRDSDLQEKELGTLIQPPYQRGDLVFFPDHVGIMVDDTTLLHANAHHMMVTLDPVHDVASRIGQDITAVKRFT